MRKTLICLISLAVLLCPSALLFTACSNQAAATEYVITAEYFPDERTLQADMTVRAVNTSENALDALEFQLYPNAYREGAKYKPVSPMFEEACFYNGKSYGKLEIESLTGGEYNVCGEDENILRVALSEPLYPDETAEISLRYTLTLSENCHRLGVGKNAVNLALFYPVLCNLGENGFEEYVYTYCGDPFVSACADYEVTLTVPEDYTLIYGGTGNCVTQNGKSAYNVVAKNVRDIAFVLGKNFECVDANAGGVRVEYYYQFDKDPQATLQAAVDAVNFYSEAFSPYGDERYVVAETDFLYGGMEYSTLALISNTLHASERAQVVAHETAHQWWYYKVGSNQFTEAWQDEGLAEYSTALFFEEYPSYGSSYKERVALSERSYRAYFSVYSQLGGADTTMSRPLTAYNGEYEYRSVAYDKGVIMLDRVRQAVGDKKFFAALARYAGAFDKKQATRSDFLSCFEQTGANTEGLFLSFLDGLCVI